MIALTRALRPHINMKFLRGQRAVKSIADDVKIILDTDSRNFKWIMSLGFITVITPT